MVGLNDVMLEPAFNFAVALAHGHCRIHVDGGECHEHPPPQTKAPSFIGSDVDQREDRSPHEAAQGEEIREGIGCCC